MKLPPNKVTIKEQEKEGTQRVIEGFSSAFHLATQCSDIKEALTLLRRWINAPTIEELKPVRYNEFTGESEELAWKPLELTRWRGHLWCGWGNNPNIKGTPLFSSLSKAIQLDTLIALHIGEDIVVLERVPERDEGGGDRPEHFRMRVALG